MLFDHLAQGGQLLRLQERLHRLGQVLGDILLVFVFCGRLALGQPALDGQYHPGVGVYRATSWAALWSSSASRAANSSISAWALARCACW